MTRFLNNLSLQNRALQVLFSMVILFIPLKNALYQVSYGLFALLFLFVVIKSRSYRLFQENARFSLIFVLIAVSMAVSNYFGLEGDGRWELLLKFVFRYTILFFAVIFLLKEGIVSSRFILSILAVSFSIQALDGIYQQYTGYDIFLNRPLYGLKVLTAATYNRNVLGFILFINSAILIYFAISSVQEKASVRNTAIACLLLAISGYALLHTGSRSSWVALAVFLSIFLPMNFRALGKRSYVAIAVILVITMWYVSRDEYIYSQFNLLLDAPVRQQIWRFSLERFFLSPVFGYGLNSYSTLGGPHVAMPHNIVMEILLFLGVVGMVLFSTLFAMICALSLKVIREDRPLGTFVLALFIAILVEYLFDHSITDGKITNTVLFTVMAVIVDAGNRVVIRTGSRVTN